MSIESLIQSIQDRNYDFEALIKNLKEHKRNSLQLKDEDALLKIERPDKSYHYYLVSDECIGKGTYGQVYITFKIDPECYEVDSSKLYVAKWHIEDPDPIYPKDVEKEHAILSHYYFSEPIIRVGRSSVVISEYLPGCSLDNVDFVNFSLSERLNVIWQLFLNLNNFHKQNYRSPAISHNDIKSSNAIYSSSQGLNVIDFGLSVVCNPNQTFQLSDVYGSPYYFPLETLRGKYGKKTDIYMSVAVINTILGGKHSFDDKYAIMPVPFKLNKRKNESLQAFKLRKKIADREYQTAFDEAKECAMMIPYQLDGLYKHHFGEFKGISLRSLLGQFIYQMQNNDFYKRPSTEACLRFFTSLNIFFQCDPNEKKYENLREQHLAIMLLVQKGLWEHKIEEIQVSEIPYAELPNLCRNIIALGIHGTETEFLLPIKKKISQFHKQSKISEANKTSANFYLKVINGLTAIGTIASLVGGLCYLQETTPTSNFTLGCIASGIISLGSALIANSLFAPNKKDIPVPVLADCDLESFHI